MEVEKINFKKTEGLKRSSSYLNDVSNSSSDMDPELVRLSETSKDQEPLILKFNPNADDNQKISESDDDLPPALPQKTTKKNFEKDDVVWLHSGKDYWPALVTNVRKKTSKIYVKPVNSHRKQKAFAVCARRLLDFDDDKRNSQLLKLGKSRNPDIEKAYERVTRFYCKKLSGKKISATRFLTYDSDDMFYGAFEGDESATNNSVHEDKQQENAATESDTECEELERVENEITLTEEERKTRYEKAWKLLRVIKSKQCWKHLRCIYLGKCRSVRHDLFMSCDRNNRETLLNIAGMSVFFDSNALDQLLSVLKEYRKKLKKVVNSNDYMFYVMLPEAIIFAIQKVQKVSKEEAAKIYAETSAEF